MVPAYSVAQASVSALQVLQRAHQQGLLPACRDARFVTELVSGVTRWRRRLDYVICQLTDSADVSELDPPMTQVLRSASRPCRATGQS